MSWGSAWGDRHGMLPHRGPALPTSRAAMGAQGPEAGIWGHSTLILCLPHPLTSCATLVKLLNISEPPSIICETEDSSTQCRPLTTTRSVGFIEGF